MPRRRLTVTASTPAPRHRLACVWRKLWNVLTRHHPGPSLGDVAGPHQFALDGAEDQRCRLDLAEPEDEAKL